MWPTIDQAFLHVVNAIKLKAATYAETYLKRVANLELPPLQWKESRTV